jgi:hypothetical protein
MKCCILSNADLHQLGFSATDVGLNYCVYETHQIFQKVNVMGSNIP